MSESTPRRPAYNRLLDRAVRILAVRDHSEQELRRKLSAPVMGKNGPEEIDAAPEDYERVIAWCHEHNYLDDHRFVSRFIASRSRKGYGPARIRQELNQKALRVRRLNAQCVNARLSGCLLLANRRSENMANPYQPHFRKRSKSSVSCFIVAI